MTTAKGYPTPIGDVDNDNHSDLQAIAQRHDDIHVAKTAAQITALSGTDLWTGRRIRQTDGTGTGVRQKSGLYVYDGSTWLPSIQDGIAGTGGSPVLTAATSNPNMGTSPTQDWDWWMEGDWCIGNAVFIWGTGSPTPGTGGYIIPLPVTPASIFSSPFSAWGIGHGIVTDVSTPAYRDVALLWDQNIAKAVIQHEGGTARLTGASPITLGATGDEIKVSWAYPTA